MTASVPSRIALATSEASARVGRGAWIIDSSIWVAVMTGLLQRLASRMRRFCASGTSSNGSFTAAHILAITRQITEHKKAVEALRASEEQYRAIFNASADSLVLRDADFRVVDVNPAYEAMSGRRREEALGRNGLTMSPPELTAHVKQLHALALAGERVMFEALARRKDGSRFNIETRGVPILHKGQPHVLYIGRDITARKTEEELLRASEEQYRAIFDASEDALVLWNSDLQRVDVNAAYERIYGYPRDFVLKGDYERHVPPEYARRRRFLQGRRAPCPFRARFFGGTRGSRAALLKRSRGPAARPRVRAEPRRRRGRRARC